MVERERSGQRRDDRGAHRRNDQLPAPSLDLGDRCYDVLGDRAEAGALNRRLRLTPHHIVHPTVRSFVLGVLILAGLLLFLGRRATDDAYITYRYANNLLSGNGLVYNVGERTLSTTTALYALLLAGLGLIWRVC